MKAIEFEIWAGELVSARLACSKVAASGPWALMQLWSEAPPGRKPSDLASYTPSINPMNSLATLRWNHGGRNVSCITNQRGGKTTKSRLSTPGVSEIDCSTRKIEGSGWS